MKRERNMLLI